jgi:aminopeptidase N
MSRFRHIIILLFSAQLLFSSCDVLPSEKKASPTELLADSTFDNHSYANINEVRTKHVHLELDVNFENKTIYGVARHELMNSGADTVIFDIKNLDIQKVTIGKGVEKETSFMIGKWDKDSILGQPLLVNITGETKYVNIYYETTEKTEAIDWLDPELTEGKKLPFMYTQGQAILTRTWIPIQDSPANRLTYSAEVSVPSEMMAVMSAENPTKLAADGKYSFQMDQPIPCYLIALAVGDIGYKSLGGNCGVYAEHRVLGKAVNEFVDLPNMMRAAEDLYGPYKWGQYDVLVLPYSFPFGGMENPRLTFLSPTVIAGDRSLVSVVAHELAHSWSGNLVTNRSWEDFWLNEGFTVYFENRIMEQLYGKEVADILALIEFQELQDELKTISKSNYPQDAQLKLDLRDRNPDDGMTDIAYVKGAFFLKTLEAKVGREKFDVFLSSYFTNHSFQTISTENFESYLKEHLFDLHDLTFNTDEWIHGRGLPTNCLRISSDRLNKMKYLANRFVRGDDIFAKKVRWKKIKGRRKRKKEVIQLKRADHITQEWQTFIRALPETVSSSKLMEIDRALHFSTWGNAEVQYEWLIKCISNDYEDAKPSIARFLKHVGRRKYVLPIFQELAKTPKNKQWAKALFQEIQSTYHPITRTSVFEVLK